MPSNNPAFYSPAGDKKKTVYRWNAEQTELVAVREIDIQEEYDELSKGCTIQEQIGRIMKGDLSVQKPESEAVYADVSQVPETTGEAIQQAEDLALQEMARAQAARKAKMDAAKKELEEAKAKLAELEKTGNTEDAK